MAVSASTHEIFLVVANLRLVDALRQSLKSSHHRLQEIGCMEDFLDHAPRNGPACLLLEFGGASLDHTQFPRPLAQCGLTLPFIFVLAESDTPATVAAMRA